MASDPTRPEPRVNELRWRDRPASRPNGQLDRPSRLLVDKESGRLAFLGPADAFPRDRVVDVHQRSPEAPVPVLQKRKDDEVRRAKDEVGRGHDMLACPRLHAKPANSGAKGGV